MLAEATLFGENGFRIAHEREHILRVLRETNGVIVGVHGAAMHLGLKRTTLLYRMEKLGIAHQSS